MFVRNSEVQKHLGESEACMLFQNIFGVLQPPTSVLRPYHSAVHVTYTANVTRNSVDKHSNTVPFDSRSTTILSAPMIRIHTCTGGAWPPVARACAPVCPSLAMPLNCCQVHL